MANPKGEAGDGAARPLVVITYHFPSDGAVGGLRWAGLTKYLARRGWSSSVLTAAPSAPERSVEDVAVECWPRRRTLNDLYLAIRSWAAARTFEPGFGSVNGDPRARRSDGLVARLRLETAMLLGLPDQGRGWILRCASRARSLIRRVQPRVVVSSGPPHSVHLATWLATRGLGVPWLVDLRDSWAGLTSEAWRDSPWYRSRLWRGTQKTLERLVAKGATAFCANSPQLVNTLAARYPRLAVHWVPNGVDRELLPQVSAAPFRGVGIVYTGGIYGWRSFEPVLRALRLFLDRHSEAEARESKLRVAGALEASQVGSLRAAAASLGLSSHVEFLGLLPRNAALDVLARSRLAVVLAQGQVVEIPAKLYEPVAMGIPCVVLAPPDSAPAVEARRIGATWVGPNDAEAVASLLENVWAGRLGIGPGVSSAIDYEVVAQQVSELLDGIANGAP